MDDTKREKRIHGTHGFPFQIYPALEVSDPDLVPYHWHPENEIILIGASEVELTIGDRKYTGRQGDVYFVRSGELHEIRGTPAGRSQSFVFPMDFLQFSRADLAQSEFLAPLADGQLVFRTALTRGQQGSDEISAALHGIVRACIDKHTGYELMVKAGLLQIVATAASLGLLVPRAGKTDYKQETLRSIVAYLDAHCTEHLRLDAVAANFGLSPQYFCTFFKENLGRTLTQHVNFLRVERASRMLRDTDDPISEIALSVGFDNFSYFIKRFRACFGCTPSEYRRTATGSVGA
ncbi:MAG: AraC family transcriptional regulator [Clostridia bacterium]|nr:AraC family transcriptional regulator [Clostridia bacterium]